MKNFFRNLFLAALFMGGFSLEATHIMGGEITWSCTPSGQYIFKMKLYRDCQGDLGAFFSHSASLQLPDNWRTGDFPDVSRNANRYISGLQCPELSRCHGTELFQFRWLSGEWRWSSGRKCLPDRSGHFERNSAGQWLGIYLEFLLPKQHSGQYQQPGGTGHTLRAIMYPFTPPGGTGPLNANPCYDNSPVFEENANTVICTGYPFTYNHNATDAELDSLFTAGQILWTMDRVGIHRLHRPL